MTDFESPLQSRATVLALAVLMSLSLPLSVSAWDDEGNLTESDSEQASGVVESSGGFFNRFNLFAGGGRDEGPAAPAGPSWLSNGAVQRTLQNLRQSIAGRDVTLTDVQRQNLQNMRPVLTELAGQDGMFNRADIPDVVRSLDGQLRSRVSNEIQRRKRARVQEAPLLFRLPVAIGANVHVNRNYDNYFRMGMNQGRGMVRSGLEEFFTGAGVEGQGRNPVRTHRNLSLSQLENEFQAGARTLQQIDQQRAATGSRVRVVFPNGFGVADLDSILADPNRRPPNGRVVPREIFSSPGTQIVQQSASAVRPAYRSSPSYQYSAPRPQRGFRRFRRR